MRSTYDALLRLPGPGPRISHRKVTLTLFILLYLFRAHRV